MRQGVDDERDVILRLALAQPARHDMKSRRRIAMNDFFKRRVPRHEVGKALDRSFRRGQRVIGLRAAIRDDKQRAAAPRQIAPQRDDGVRRTAVVVAWRDQRLDAGGRRARLVDAADGVGLAVRRGSWFSRRFCGGDGQGLRR